MKNVKTILGMAALGAAAACAFSQGLDKTTLLKPLSDSWPTYNGDYSGRRFSLLTQINSGNVNTLSLAWAARFTAGDEGGGRGAATVAIKATPLMVNGILYFSAPNNVRHLRQLALFRKSRQPFDQSRRANRQGTLEGSDCRS
jgi:glucose dehydrogenase